MAPVGVTTYVMPLHGPEDVPAAADRHVPPMAAIALVDEAVDGAVGVSPDWRPQADVSATTVPRTTDASNGCRMAAL